MIINRGITKALGKAAATVLDDVRCLDAVKLSKRFHAAVDRAVGHTGNREDVLAFLKKAEPETFARMNDIAQLAELHILTASSHECPRCNATAVALKMN